MTQNRKSRRRSQRIASKKPSAAAGAQFSRRDIAQLRKRGIALSEAKRQIALFQQPPASVRIVRPCTRNDGVRRLSDLEIERAISRWDNAARAGRLLKFVPASGAASRMFQGLVACLDAASAVKSQRRKQSLSEEASAFIKGLSRFAFRDALKEALASSGLDLDVAAASGRFEEICKYLLTSQGLNYAALPKALILFHSYPDGPRTALEEHLVEAVGYVKDKADFCRLHLTVSPEHRDLFSSFLKRVVPTYEGQLGCRFKVEISVQKPSTDTLAVDDENLPFRSKDGALLFRPGGHGSLIENLNDMRGDIVFIKNIDNVAPDRLKGDTIKWKRILAGVLVELQGEVFKHIMTLKRTSVSAGAIEDAAAFAKARNIFEVPKKLSRFSKARLKKFLISKLNRPIRVCGVVPNEKEPGGGPFWAKGAGDEISLQIVEGAQIDGSSPEQRRIFSSSRYFNPVDLVCGLRDCRGAQFNLERYVDRQAVFISRKSDRGRHLKALERPGLWNGAMADWNTFFIEVPVSTFNPIKTLLDLLRPAHQPAAMGSCA